MKGTKKHYMHTMKYQKIPIMKKLCLKLPCDQVIVLLGVFNRAENMSVHSIIINAHSSIIRNSPKVETTPENSGKSIQWTVTRL